jgi:predicted small metal-binding protein
MARKAIDCRDFPSENRCTVVISADTDQEVLDAAVAHAVKSHGHMDSPDLRAQIRHGIKETASV